MFGSERRWRNAWNGFISSSSAVLPARASVTGSPSITTSRPSANARTSSSDAAMPSTAPTSTASLAADETAFSTVEIAQATFRPRSSAIARIFAIVSLKTLSRSVSGMSVPSERIGEAAPMFVPGAMTATWLASVMNVPALAARPPAGATQTMTGTSASSRLPTIS